jgi:hypothetical protein
MSLTLLTDVVRLVVYEPPKSLGVRMARTIWWRLMQERRFGASSSFLSKRA